MKILRRLRRELSQGRFEFSRHAFHRAVERNISDAEIREMAMNARLIEDYPDDKYTASCLLLGFSKAGRPLHIQVSRAETELVKIITLYEPDPDEWNDRFTQRRVQ
ncbi:MAG: DUF4258 domain-containing protein [Caldilineaceae bacterium]|nr:DUF4258 domain-containing protein [Caldilineaceae bacterium]MBP8106322.1 DUF4258 domain-containing protein [Caldilineaceae bacterium]MBP9071122.1 DUF4258 domain-containing protein [Caldilineaceae bacterium]